MEGLYQVGSVSSRWKYLEEEGCGGGGGVACS